MPSTLSQWSEILRTLAALLSEQPSSLVYYLLALFALQLALSMAFSRFQLAKDGGAGRLTLGSGLALALRIAFGVGALLVITGLLAPQWQPPVDRAIALATLLLLGWSLLSQQPSRALDLLLVLTLIATFIGAIASTLLWLPSGFSARPFNFSLYDIAWQIAILVSSGLLALLLLIRRPSDWGTALSLPLLWGLSAGLHLTVGIMGQPLGGDYDGWRRLAELAIFPIYAGIVYRHTLRQALAQPATPLPAEGISQPDQPEAVLTPDAETETETASEPISLETGPLDPKHLPSPLPPLGADGRARMALAADAAEALVEIGLQDDFESTARSITRAVGRALLSDLTMLWLPPENETLTTASVYDLIRERELPPLKIPAAKLPTINSALKRGQPARLRPAQQMSELIALGDAIRAHQTGPAFLVPIFHEGETLGGIMVYSPHAQRMWSGEEQRLLDSISGPLGAALHLANTQPERDQLAEQLTQVEEALQIATKHGEQLFLELQDATTQREAYRQEVENLTSTMRLHNEAASIEDAALAHMRDELHSLQEKIDTLSAQRTALEEKLSAAEKSKNVTFDALKARLKVLQAERTRQGKLNQELARANSAATLKFEEAKQAWQREQAILLQKLSELTALPAEQEPAVAEEEEPETEPVIENRVNGRHTEPANDEQPTPDDATLITPTPTDESIAATPAAELALQLRQPMGSVIKTTDQLLDETLGSIGVAQRKHLERIRANVTRMSAIMDALLDVSGKQTGGNTLVIEPVDVLDIVDEALMACSAQFRDKNLILSIDIADNLPTIQADPEALHKVLQYLLSNAFVVTPSKGEVRIQARINESADELRAKYLLIAITDSGGGIDPIDQSRVFNQTWRSANPPIKGLAPDDGIALSQAKALVEAHKGRLWFESNQDDKITTFNVLLPMHVDDFNGLPPTLPPDTSQAENA